MCKSLQGLFVPAFIVDTAWCSSMASFSRQNNALIWRSSFTIHVIQQEWFRTVVDYLPNTLVYHKYKQALAHSTRAKFEIKIGWCHCELHIEQYRLFDLTDENNIRLTLTCQSSLILSVTLYDALQWSIQPDLPILTTTTTKVCAG